MAAAAAAISSAASMMSMSGVSPGANGSNDDGASVMPLAARSLADWLWMSLLKIVRFYSRL
jgi:hypothetical protein